MAKGELASLGGEVSLANKNLVKALHGPVQGSTDGLGAGLGESLGNLRGR